MELSSYFEIPETPRQKRYSDAPSWFKLVFGEDVFGERLGVIIITKGTSDLQLQSLLIVTDC
jgi:hypothetical protein